MGLRRFSCDDLLDTSSHSQVGFNNYTSCPFTGLTAPQEAQMHIPGLPPKQGLYDPANEKDGCGIGFVANIKGVPSHDIVRKGLQVLDNLFHRGAQGCDPCTGDGAGILLQVPHAFLKQAAADVHVKLPGAVEYGVGMVFLPRDAAQRRQCEQLFEQVIAEEHAHLLGWRDVPVNRDAIGVQARRTEPVIRQIFIARGTLTPSQFERNEDLRSEEHTSELQSRFDLVCRLLLEKKKKKRTINI